MSKKLQPSNLVQQKARTPNDYYREKLEQDLAKLEKVINKLNDSIVNHEDELKSKHNELEQCMKQKDELTKLKLYHV